MFPTRSTRETRSNWTAVATLLGGLLLVYYLLPLAALVAVGSRAAVLSRLASPRILGVVATSVLTAATSALAAAGFGLPLAYWLARTDSPYAPLVTAIVVLPLVLPPVVSGMLLLTIVGPDGPVGAAANVAGISLTRSFAGVVLAQTFVASPFVVVTAKAAFESVDRTVEEAARTLGRSRLATIRHVVVPLAKPGILAGVTLAFARSMGEFGATIMLAYYPRTMPVEIWVSFTTGGVDRALPLALVLAVIAVVALVLLRRLGTSPWE
jgi:molybdate/tungstate transport system permease protein